MLAKGLKVPSGSHQEESYDRDQRFARKPASEFIESLRWWDDFPGAACAVSRDCAARYQNIRRQSRSERSGAGLRCEWTVGRSKPELRCSRGIKPVASG